MNKLFIFTVCLVFSLHVYSEMSAIADDELNTITGQSGITINAKIKLGSESRFVYTNSGGITKASAGNNASYVIADNISGAIEIKGLKLDLISDLDNSGKSALQWTLPEKIIAEDFKIGGIYASSSETVNSNSSFLVGLNIDGTLLLPAATAISVFVVE